MLKKKKRIRISFNRDSSVESIEKIVDKNTKKYKLYFFLIKFHE